MDLNRQVRLAMDAAIQSAKNNEEEQRMRAMLKSWGYDDEQLEGVNLAGLKALVLSETGGVAATESGAQPLVVNDCRMAFDARRRANIATQRNELAERYGVPAPRKL